MNLQIRSKLPLVLTNTVNGGRWQKNNDKHFTAN